MFYSTKTESYDQQNLNPNDFYENPTIYQGVIATDFALSKALDNISELQSNLTFMINLNQQLKAENDKLKANSEKLNQYIKTDITNRQNQMKQMEKQNQQVVQLLQQTKQTLIQTQKELQQSKLQVQRCNRIIYQQKKAYEDLQQNYMNQSLSYVQNSSVNIGKSDLMYIAQLEKQNNDLNIQLKRQQQQIQKNETKVLKLEKQNNQFKKWMATVLGLQKVIEGSQRILMKQISQRVLPA